MLFLYVFLQLSKYIITNNKNIYFLKLLNMRIKFLKLFYVIIFYKNSVIYYMNEGVMQYEHKTVLLNETVDSIDVKNGKLYVDATFGGGGHSRLILSKADDIRLFVFDQDIEAIENGKLNFSGEKRINFINDNFVNIKKIFKL